MKKILYISYDGMTDPLGQSQVIPYLAGLSREGYQFTILSFEKKGPYSKLSGHIRSLLAESGIQWVPMSFSTRPPLVSKFYDAVRMRRKAISLHNKQGFDMTHCRSYLGANIGLLLKKRFGVKFFFDMRGFWADEKRDGGAWPASSWLFRRVYAYFKRKEKEFLRNADYIISLTQAGKQEMTTWPAYDPRVPLAVIPCCADMDHFTLTSDLQKKESRELLGLSGDHIVLSYLGSLGAWYMLDEMLSFFSELRKEYPGALFLIITHSDPGLIESRLDRYGISCGEIKIVKAERKEVPVFCKAADLSVSFIKPVYSKMSSSPTKIGELLSMGIPVITNSGVGDMEFVMEQTGGGYVMKQFEQIEIKRAVESVPGLLRVSPASIRGKAETIYSLSRGIAVYLRCYRQVLGTPSV